MIFISISIIFIFFLAAFFYLFFGKIEDETKLKPNDAVMKEEEIPVKSSRSVFIPSSSIKLKAREHAGIK